MKVLDLLCAHDHAFEGWFASEDDFQGQLVRGLVQCPMCGNADIRKGLSAPRLNLRTPSDPAEVKQAAATKQSSTGEDMTHQAMQAAWLHMARQIMSRTEDVGERFASEADACTTARSTSVLSVARPRWSRRLNCSMKALPCYPYCYLRL